MLHPQKGVILPSYLKMQKRITDGSKVTNGSNEYFSYFPSRLVVGGVFPLLSNYRAKYLLYGKAGIAKTTSIILYCHLSSIVTEYKYKYGEEDDAIKGIPYVPKIFYFTYRDDYK